MRTERITTTVYVASATNCTSTEPTVTTTCQSFGRPLRGKEPGSARRCCPIYGPACTPYTRVQCTSTARRCTHAAQHERNSCGGGGGRVSCIVTAEPSSHGPGQQHLSAAGDHAGTTHVTPVLYSVDCSQTSNSTN